MPILKTDEPVCPEGKLSCGNGECIEKELFCNDKPDCKDESDENACSKYLQLLFLQFSAITEPLSRCLSPVLVIPLLQNLWMFLNIGTHTIQNLFIILLWLKFLSKHLKKISFFFSPSLAVELDPNRAPDCDSNQCVLPDCFCSADGTRIPGGIEPNQVKKQNYNSPIINVPLVAIQYMLL